MSLSPIHEKQKAKNYTILTILIFILIILFTTTIVRLSGY